MLHTQGFWRTGVGSPFLSLLSCAEVWGSWCRGAPLLIALSTGALKDCIRLSNKDRRRGSKARSSGRYCAEEGEHIKFYSLAHLLQLGQRYHLISSCDVDPTDCSLKTKVTMAR